MTRRIAEEATQAEWANVLIGGARRAWEARFRPKLPPGLIRKPGR